MNSAKIAWALCLLLLVVIVLQNGTRFRSRGSINRQREYFAWEKTPEGTYKQVKKNYFLNEQLCHNVISVLNDTSTTAPPSNWILAGRTNSTFECWPADVDPSTYYKKYSIFSDDPAARPLNERR